MINRLDGMEGARRGHRTRPFLSYLQVEGFERCEIQHCRANLIIVGESHSASGQRCCLDRENPSKYLSSLRPGKYPVLVRALSLRRDFVIQST